MNWRRVWAVMVRLWYGTLRSFDRLTDSFYWITLDLILWGITAGYVQTLAPKQVEVFFMITASVILWNVVYRSQVDIGIGLLDELWNKNLINLFVSPLKLDEWLVALLIFSLFKTVLAVIFGAFVAYLLYSFFLFELSWYLVPFFIILLMTGWWVGFLVTGLILRFTTKVQALAWTSVWILAPLSAVYFPLSSLPPSVQLVAKAVPTSYVFEQMRALLNTGKVDWMQLLIPCVLNLVYVTASVIFVRRSFAKVLERGLVKVY